MRARGQSGKLHWVFLLFIALVVVFAAMVLTPLISELRQPPYVAQAARFMNYLCQNRIEEAAKLLDVQSLPKEKHDLKKIMEERSVTWGTIKKISLVDVVQSPADLKHPKAREGVRVDFHLKCYLAQGSAFIYLVPHNNDWVIVDYILQ